MRSGSKAAFWSRISVIASVAKQSRAAYARSGLPRAFGPRNDDIKSGLADRDVAGRFGLRGLDLLREQAVKIDRFEQQRRRSEEHTSELQSIMSSSYAVFCLKKKKKDKSEHYKN